MDSSSGSQGNGSFMDQNSLGILNMDNLKGKQVEHAGNKPKQQVIRIS